MNKDLKILIADDSAFMRKVLKDILEGEGYSNFIEAENGKQAVEKFNSEEPGLLLLDIIMPQMNGVEVLKEIGNKATVLVISAVGQEDMIKEATENGAKGYITKPFENEDVISELNKVLG